MAVPNPDLEIVTVYESDDTVAFNLAKAALDEGGVEYAAIEEALTGYGFSPIINPVCRIQVEASHRERALELIGGGGVVPEVEETSGNG